MSVWDAVPINWLIQAVSKPANVVTDVGRTIGRDPVAASRLNKTFNGRMSDAYDPPTSTRFVRAPSFRSHLMGSASPNQPSEHGTSIADILAHLDELQNPSRFMPDEELLASKAHMLASAQYEPVIARLRNQMGLAETRANRNKDALGQMFSQLSSNLAADIPSINQTFDQTKQDTASQYQKLQDSIRNQYAQTQAEQENMMKRLNIQAAAPDALHQQQVDRDYFSNLASTNAQTQQDALGQEQRGNVEYTRRGSELAKTEGTQRQADLMFQLQDLLAQYQGQIGEAQDAESAAYATNLDRLMGQASSSATDEAQRQFENYIKVLNLSQSLTKGQQVGSVQSPADVANRVLGLGLDQNSAQTIQSIFMDSLSNDPIIQAGIDPNFGQALPKEALASRVVEEGRRNGLNAQQLNALQVAALEYFGRR